MAEETRARKLAEEFYDEVMSGPDFVNFYNALPTPASGRDIAVAWMVNFYKLAESSKAREGQTAPPQHPFEMRISIGGDDWDYIVRTLDELARHIPDHGPECNLCSGGAGGSHSVTLTRRDVSPDQFRAELAEWHSNYLQQRREPTGQAQEALLQIVDGQTMRVWKQHSSEAQEAPKEK